MVSPRLMPIRKPVDSHPAIAAGLLRCRVPGDPDAPSRLLRRLEAAEQPLTAIFTRATRPDWPGPDAA